jgi:hypothetical protein
MGIQVSRTVLAHLLGAEYRLPAFHGGFAVRDNELDAIDVTEHVHSAGLSWASMRGEAE